MLAIWIVACGWGSAPAPALAQPHYAGFDAFVDAAALGDVDRARSAVDGLSLGDPATFRGPSAAVSAVGGAIGFVRVADADELGLAVAQTASACGSCHADVKSPPRPAWAHRTGAAWAAWGLVWNDASAPPAGADVPEALRAAWSAGAPEDHVATALSACAGCHHGRRTP